MSKNSHDKLFKLSTFCIFVLVYIFHGDSAEYLYTKANSSSTFKCNLLFKHIGLCISVHSQFLQSYHSNSHKFGLGWFFKGRKR